MRIHTRALAAAMALGAVTSAQAQTVAAAPGDDADRGGSSYLKCDGQPNNYTTGEAAARLLGAVTLLGVFAPGREAADSSKRVKGAGGVAACTAMLDGERREGNPERRIGLILARALHQIEDKKYDAALADVTLAEREAAAAGLSGNTYWVRSRGRSFGLIRSAALFRLGRVGEARDAALATTSEVELSFLAMMSVPEYTVESATSTPAEIAFIAARSRLNPLLLEVESIRLGNLGRFREAAGISDAVLDWSRGLNPERQSTLLLAGAANNHALAGDRAGSATLAAQARENAAKRRASGTPEPDSSGVIEALDLNMILTMMADGDVKGARRLFSARSEWASVPLGQSLETLRRLREGASPDELIGGLAKSADERRAERQKDASARLIATDDDNATLFRLVPSLVPAKSYEAVSAKVWKTDGSKLILKPSAKPKPGVAYDLLFLGAADLRVLPEAYMLHAALLARSRGHQGFTIMPIFQGGIFAARISTGKRGDPGMPEPAFNDSAEVIAALTDLIPTPEALRLRRTTG